MIDFHTHTFNSDGELLISELVRRASVNGYRAIAITDHCDFSNVETLIKSVIKVKQYLEQQYDITILAGIEITHVPPVAIADLANAARSLGAQIIVVHGETIVEPVKTGTNRAAIRARVDVLAHPGLISDEDVSLAAELGVALEITSRHGHCLTNGHVVRLSLKYHAKMVIDSDTHSIDDLLTRDKAILILKGAGLSDSQAKVVLENNENLLRRAQ